MDEEMETITAEKVKQIFGAHYDRYQQVMSKWFSHRYADEQDEYQNELRTFLTPQLLRFHNEIIRSVILKSSIEASSSVPYTLTEEDCEPRTKKAKPRVKYVDLSDFLPVTVTKAFYEELLGKRVHRFLPDPDTMQLKFKTTASVYGVNSVDPKCCKILVNAVPLAVKNLLDAIICGRSGYKFDDKGRFRYDHGIPAINPWLRRSVNHFEEKKLLQCAFNQIVWTKHESTENDISSDLALTAHEPYSNKPPIGIEDVFRALMLQPSLIPVSTNYHTFVERLILSKHHPSWEDLQYE